MDTSNLYYCEFHYIKIQQINKFTSLLFNWSYKDRYWSFWKRTLKVKKQNKSKFTTIEITMVKVELGVKIYRIVFDNLDPIYIL